MAQRERKRQNARMVLEGARITCGGKSEWSGLEHLLQSALCPNPVPESAAGESRPYICTLKRVCNCLQFQCNILVCKLKKVGGGGTSHSSVPAAEVLASKQGGKPGRWGYSL